MHYTPTKSELAIIRNIGLEESRRNGNGMRRVQIEIGIRFNTRISSYTIKPNINIFLVTTAVDGTWEDTDLYDKMDWVDFRKGFELTEGGEAIIDMYLYEPGYAREFCSNIQVYFDNNGMTEIHADSPKKLWERQE